MSNEAVTEQRMPRACGGWEDEVNGGFATVVAPRQVVLPPAAKMGHYYFMARAHDLHRPSWWGPDWLHLPAAFWLSVLTSAAITGVLEGVLLRLFFPSLYTPHRLHQGPLATGDYYAYFTGALGALPPLQLWKRALHRRGLHSWDD